MYKVIYVSPRDGSYEIQKGDISPLAKEIKKQAEQGYELLTMTTCPYSINTGHVGFVLVFKKIK